MAKKKQTGNFYGQPIAKGALHRKMHVAKGNKIPLARINSMLAALKKKPHKTAAQLKKEKELVFAKNAKSKWGH